MSQFTLDYTQPPPARHTRAKRSGWARFLVLFMGWTALSPMVVLGLLAGLFHYRAENQGLRYQQQHYLIRYDSLLSAKQATDRQLLNLQQQAQQQTDTVTIRNSKKEFSGNQAGF